MSETRYMISDASRQLHVEAHVLRYWEDELQMEIPRTELGHRYYTKRHLLIFERIKQLKDAGYQLKAIKLILPKLDQLDEDEFEFISLVAEEMNRKAAEVYGDPLTVQVETETASEEEDGTGVTAFCRPEGDTQAEDVAETKKKDGSRKNSAGQPEAASAMKQEEDTETQAERKSQEDKAAQEESEKQPEEDEASDSKDTGAESSLTLRERFPANVIPMTRPPEQLTHEEKLQQFQNVMTAAVSNAMQLQAKQFGTLLSEQVSEKLLTEMEYLLRIRQEQEELRFQQLDETIRSHQKSMQEAAAGHAPARKKRRR